MRITNSMMVSNYMNNLTTNLTKLDKLQGQLATNRKWAHISDDPISVIYSQQAREKLRKLSQYQSNVESAQGWIAQAETSVMDFNKIIVSAYESALDASTDVKSEGDKNKASNYMRELRDQVLNSLNTTYGDKYIFAGYNGTGHQESGTQINPFTFEDETYDAWLNPNDPSAGTEKRTRSVLYFNGIRVSNNEDEDEKKLLDKLSKETLNFDIGLGVEIGATVHGLEMIRLDSYEDAWSVQYDTSTDPPTPVTSIRETNLFEMLDMLYRDMEDSERQLEGAGSGEEAPPTGTALLTPYISRLQKAQDHVLGITADIGGRSSRLELVASRYEQDELNYTKMKSDAEDMDQAEIIMNYKMAESIYKAALSTGSYIIQPTLMDFLK